MRYDNWREYDFDKAVEELERKAEEEKKVKRKLKKGIDKPD